MRKERTLIQTNKYLCKNSQSDVVPPNLNPILSIFWLTKSSKSPMVKHYCNSVNVNPDVSQVLSCRKKTDKNNAQCAELVQTKLVIMSYTKFSILIRIMAYPKEYGYGLEIMNWSTFLLWSKAIWSIKIGFEFFSYP